MDSATDDEECPLACVSFNVRVCAYGEPRQKTAGQVQFKCTAPSSTGNFGLLHTKEGKALLVPSSQTVGFEERTYGVQSVALEPGNTVLLKLVGPKKYKAHIRKLIKKHIQPFVNLNLVIAKKGKKTQADGTIRIKFAGATGLAGVCTCLGCKDAEIELNTDKEQGPRPPAFLLAHELGHYFGLAHEASHPGMKLKWIKKRVEARFGEGAMDQFQQEEGPLSVLPFERNSVMSYDIPASLNKQGVSLKTSKKGYTDMDKLWLFLTYGEPGSGAGPRPTFPDVNDKEAIDALLKKVRAGGKKPQAPGGEGPGTGTGSGTGADSADTTSPPSAAPAPTAPPPPADAAVEPQEAEVPQAGSQEAAPGITITPLSFDQIQLKKIPKKRLANPQSSRG